MAQFQIRFSANGGIAIANPFIVAADQPLQVALDAYASVAMVPGAMFIDPDGARTEHFTNGVNGAQMSVLRMLLDGDRIHPHMTARQVSEYCGYEQDEVMEIDLMLGQGGPASFPEDVEVFNTPAGALSYYQREIRQLRAQAFNQQHAAQQEHQVAQQQQQVAQQQNHILQQGLAHAEEQIQTLMRERTSTDQRHTQAINAIRQQHAAELVRARESHERPLAEVSEQLAAERRKSAKLGQQLSDEQAGKTRMESRITTLERQRTTALHQIKELRKEKLQKEREAAREVQLAKLRRRDSRPSASPVTGAVTRSPILSTELRTLGIA